MPKVSEMFPSKYLQAADFGGKEFTLTIARLHQDEVGQGDSKEVKWIVYFAEAQKGLVLNVTNAGVLEYLYGEHSEGWVGKQIVLFTEMVQFGRKMVPGIRMRSPNAGLYAGATQVYADATQAPLGGSSAGNGPIGPGEQAAAQAKTAEQSVGQPMPSDPADLDDPIPF